MRRSFLLASLIACLLGLFAASAFAGPMKDLAVTILRIDDGNPAKLKLTAGTEKGVQVGTSGYLVDGEGKRVAGGNLKVVSVESKSCVAEVPLPSAKVDGSFGAVLQVP